MLRRTAHITLLFLILQSFAFAQDDINLQLLYAVESNDIPEIKSLLKKGADVNMTTSVRSPNYMFHLSRDLYLQGLSKTMEGQQVYVGAIHANATRANIKVLKYLAKQKINIDAGDSRGKTPLMYALRSPGGEEYALYLIRKGANYAARDETGNTAIHYAAFGGNFEGVQMTVAGGLDINEKNDEGITPMHAAAVRSPHVLMDKMLDLGADLKAVDDVGMNVLHYAAGYGDTEKVRWILMKAPELVCVSKNGYSPLDIARMAGNNDILPILMNAGDDYYTWKYEELREAVKNSDKTAVAMLLKMGANPKRIDGEPLLHTAAGNGSPGVMDLLLRNGADINARNEQDQTAMEFAIEHNQPRAAKQLLQDGAFPDNRLLPMAIEQYMNQKEEGPWIGLCLDLSLKIGDPGVPGGELNIPSLHYAAYAGMEQIVNDLLKRGEDPTRLDDDGWTALHWAVLNNDLRSFHPEKINIIRSLIKAGAPVTRVSLKQKTIEKSGPFPVRYFPKNAAPLDILDYALPRDTEMERALESFEALKTLTGENYFENAKAYIEIKNYAAALLDLNRAIVVMPENDRAYFLRGICKMELGKFTEAVPDFTQALRFNGNFPEAFLARGKCQFETGNYRAAEGDFTLAVKSGFQLGESLYWRGETRLKNHDRDGACADFNKSQEEKYSRAADALKLYCE